MNKIKNPSTDRLFRAILGLETVEECYKFFEDLCTIKELQDFSLRLDVAVMLSEGIKYQEISSKTGASTTTISRVNKCLNYGEGYEAALKRLNAKGKA